VVRTLERAEESMRANGEIVSWREAMPQPVIPGLELVQPAHSSSGTPPRPAI